MGRRLLFRLSFMLRSQENRGICLAAVIAFSGVAYAQPFVYQAAVMSDSMTSLSGFPITDNGQISFFRNLSLVGGPASSIQTLVAPGSAVPGTAFTFGSSFTGPAYSGNKFFAFTNRMTGPGVNTTNEQALFVGPVGSPQMIARAGDPAPGASDGARYGNFGSFSVNHSGDILFAQFLSGPGLSYPNNIALFTSSAGAAPQLALRTGMQAPDLPAGTTLTVPDSGLPPLPENQRIALRSSLEGIGVDSSNDAAIFAGPVNALRLIQRTGDPATAFGNGAVYRSLGLPSTSAADSVIFQGLLGGGGITTSNDDYLAVKSGSFTTVVAREGDAAPGSGMNYNSFDTTAINSHGRIAIKANLRNSAGGTLVKAVYSGTPRAPELVALGGAQAPGAPSGTVFPVFDLGTPILNERGEVALLNNVTYPDSSNHPTLYLYEPGIGSLPVVRVGDSFNVGGGVTKTISGISIATNSYGRSSLGDDGLLTFHLGFSNGPDGIFTASLLAGDGNADGAVDSSDFAMLAAHFDQTDTTRATGDFNGDGVTNALDFNVLANHFGDSAAGSFSINSIVVPEPVALAALAVLALTFTRRGRRRSPEPRSP
jgi:hypothetical protein